MLVFGQSVKTILVVVHTITTVELPIIVVVTILVVRPIMVGVEHLLEAVEPDLSEVLEALGLSAQDIEVIGTEDK